MKQMTKLHWVLAGAVSAALAGNALAQYRVGTDGRARDANLVGSGGYNQSYNGPQNYIQGNYLQNNLITGNITGGKEFRGAVPYSAPDAFRQKTGSNLSSDFIRSSSGAPYGGVPQNNAQAVQSYYGSNYAAPPPRNYVPQGIGQGAFVPGPTNQTRQAGDFRMGTVTETPTTVLPQPGQLLLPGPVDPNSPNTSSLITASPLYGVRMWNPDNAIDRQFLSDNIGRGGANALNNRMDPVTLEKMRSEVIDPKSQSQQQESIDQQSDSPDKQTGRDRSGQNLNGKPLSPLDGPQNKALSNSLQSNVSQTDGMNDSLQTGASVRLRLLTAPQQSTQYAEMQKRLDEQRGVQAKTEDYNQQNRDKQAAERKKGSGISNITATTPQPSVAPTGPVGGVNAVGGPKPAPTPLPSMTGTQPPAGGAEAHRTNVVPVPVPTPQVAIDKQPPVQIKSLAEGVNAAGLASLLKDAETQMKAGKFTSALDKYDDAEQVAPNNPLILMGRANALLGQEYFARAEQNLRKAFTQNQALLMGQYDLRSFLSADRIDSVVKSLRALADSEPREPRHVFLLAYIAYNTGNEAPAAAYLDLAEKRAGGNDPLYPLIRKYWSLPAQTSPNK